MDLSHLKHPFEAKDIEWRVSHAGQKNGQVWALVLAYVTNRAIMDRLDAVCEPHNWKNVYQNAPGGGVLCGISIRIGDEWITKWDGAEQTEIEPVKGGLSGAMKRAAVQWGIGRYLYHLDATFVTAHEGGERKDKFVDKQTKQTLWFRWDAPALPDWALPGNSDGDKQPGQEKAATAKEQKKSKPKPEPENLLSPHQQDEIKAKLKALGIPAVAFGAWLRRIVNVRKLALVPERWHQHIMTVLAERPNEIAIVANGARHDHEKEN